MAALCWSSCEEIPHAQGKRNPSKMVGFARRHQRANTLKPYSQKTSQSNHTRTTALSNSMRLSHARGATQEGRVMVERFRSHVKHLWFCGYTISINKFYKKSWEDWVEKGISHKLELFLLRMCASGRMYSVYLQYAKQVPPNGSYHNFMTNF